MARGLKKCRDNSFKFQNLIHSQLLLRIIGREQTGSEFPQACWMSFLFAFRVPSETIQLARAYSNDEINAFSPQHEKALIGIRTAPDGCFMAVNPSGARTSPAAAFFAGRAFARVTGLRRWLSSRPTPGGGNSRPRPSGLAALLGRQRAQL